MFEKEILGHLESSHEEKAVMEVRQEYQQPIEVEKETISITKETEDLEIPEEPEVPKIHEEQIAEQILEIPDEEIIEAEEQDDKPEKDNLDQQLSLF